MTRIRFEDLPSTNTPRNAENLNKLNNVVISSTEPTTGEEVWIQTDINKKIFVKNNNDIYEEFINISDIKKVSNEVILYDNTSGASGDIILSETSANFKYIEILFRTNTGGHSSLKVANPNGKYSLLSLIDDNGGDAVLWAKSTMYLISEASITVVRSHLQKIGSATVSETDNKMRILRVIGYK